MQMKVSCVLLVFKYTTGRMMMSTMVSMVLMHLYGPKWYILLLTTKE